MLLGLGIVNLFAQQENQFDEIKKIDENYSWTWKDGLKGVCDKSGVIIIPNKYDEITAFKDSLAWTYKDGNKGLIHVSGKIIIPNEYDEITNFKKGMAWTYKDGQKGLISKDGVVLIPGKYDEIAHFRENLFWTWKDGNKGLIGKDGTIFIPNKYDDIKYEDNGTFKCYKDGSVSLLSNLANLPEIEDKETKKDKGLIITDDGIQVSDGSGTVIINKDSIFITEKNKGGKDTTKIIFKKGKILIISDKDDFPFGDTLNWEYGSDFPRYRKPRFQGNWSGVEMGMNNFLDKNFKMELPADGKMMDLNTGKSWQFNLNFLHQSFSIYKDRFGFVTGLGLALNNYAFDKKIIFVPDSNPIQFTLDTIHKFKKNKLIVTYLTLPLLLEYQIPAGHARIHFAAGIIGSVKIGSRHKQVYDNDEKHIVREDFRLSPFKAEATFRMGYGGFNVFANYSFITLFEKKKGPELYPFTIGMGLTF
ncbi:MAG: hypothetical protein A2X01_10070 [Bacteroidetes bacterium GWF2_35_48]|nr:MAG: hypothetical protein A2X01_10070 [Bacteroidetes bacterium GWF2_35_48]OFY97990.1 MAG: hypothetical protein A2491_19095 [Bacteroidetes bacterium RIFOXYC12_FULL_35_7]